MFRAIKRLLFILKNIGEIEKSLNKIKEIDNMYVDHKKTINKLNSKISDLYNKVFNIKTISKRLGVDIDMNELEDLLFDCSAKIITGTRETMINYDRQCEVLDLCAREFVKTYPSIKKKYIFHGGCLGCKTPLVEGIGACDNCSYFHWMSNKPDLSEKYKDNEVACV